MDYAQETRAHRGVLFLALGAFGLVFFLWQLASQNTTINQLLYPFRLIVTFVHEAGHGLSALISGGRFIQFVVFENGAGVATTAGGNRMLVISMGYLGAALFGAVLLYAANRVHRIRVVAVLTGLFFLGCALLFTGRDGTILIGGAAVAILAWSAGGTLNGHSQQVGSVLRGVAVIALLLTFFLVRNNVALLTGIVSGTALFGLAALATPLVITFTLNVLALIVGFNALNDILALWNNQSVRLGNVPNDALALANLTNLPVNLWLLIWLIAALGMMGMSIYFGVVRPLRQAS